MVVILLINFNYMAPYRSSTFAAAGLVGDAFMAAARARRTLQAKLSWSTPTHHYHFLSGRMDTCTAGCILKS
jgi:hypothetical protein